MRLISLQHVTGKLLHPLRRDWLGESYEEVVIEIATSIIGNVLKIFLCWLHEIDARYVGDPISLVSNVEMHKHIAVPQVANIHDGSYHVLTLLVQHKHLEYEK